MSSFNSILKSQAAKFLSFAKKAPLYSFTSLLVVDFDLSILFIVFLLIGIVTFLAGTAYGIYLNDKITEKEATNQLSRS